MARNDMKWRCNLCGLQVKKSERRQHAESVHGFLIISNTKKSSKTKVKKIVGKKEAVESTLSNKTHWQDIVEVVGKSYPQKKIVDEVKQVGIIEGLRATKCSGIHKCFRCGKNHLDTWLYKNTRRGDIHICDFCKFKMNAGRRKPGSTDAMLIAIRGGFGVKK